MKATRIKSGKTGLTGWRYRFTSPVTHRITEKRFFVTEKRLAEELFLKHMDELQAEAAGGATSACWKLSYEELVKRFVEHAPISSAKRKRTIQLVLERNELALEIAADLRDVGALTSRAKKLVEAGKRSAAYFLQHVQPVLRQMSRWAFEARVLQTHPLARWRKLPFKHERSRRHAYTAEEVKIILAATRELDKTFGRKFPIEIVLRTLIVCGNRPGVMFEAKVSDLENDRIKLPPGDGKKRNGAATLPPELVQMLRVYTNKREVTAPLLVTALGNKIDLFNFYKRDFRLAAILAFVRAAWPHSDPSTLQAEPLEVAMAIQEKKPFKFDGRPPTLASTK